LKQNKLCRDENRCLKKSFSWWDRAKDIIPAGTQTLSKGRSQFIQGVAPIYIQRGEGCHVFDVDGNEYIDYALALGPITLGYGNKAVNEAVIKQMREGPCFTLMHPKEVEFSELMLEKVPWADMVRLGKNGSDVTSCAVKVARAYTGRDKIAICGYHGWQDWYIATTDWNKGIPEDVKKLSLVFKYNDIGSLEKLFTENPSKVACVIMEPVRTEEPVEDFLDKVAEITRKNGALLIFDEIVNSPRLRIGGGGEFYNVVPDIATFGKGIGNGWPISTIIGKKEFMKEMEKIFFSFTMGGETLSLAAAIATLTEIEKEGVIEKMWHLGALLQDGYNQLSEEKGLSRYTQCQGLAPHTLVTFSGNERFDALKMKTLIQQEMVKRSILFNGVHYICGAHTEKDITYTLQAYSEALDLLAQAIKAGNIDNLLEGSSVSKIFRQH